MATKLTTREREIASLIAKGLSNQDIAKNLSPLKETTVKAHVRNLLSKTGTTSRVQLVTSLLKDGTINIKDI
jgi:DNA-binding NarL/FixJ family response regulator